MSENLHHELPQELIELERSLATFAPAPARLDRDRLLFEAGRAHGQAEALTATTAASNVPHRDSMMKADQIEPQATIREAILAWPWRGDQNSKGMASIRSWRLATVAATLSALLFASLYVGQRSRHPVVVREIATAEQAPLKAGPQVAAVEIMEPPAETNAKHATFTARDRQYAVLRAPFWMLANYQPPASNRRPDYLALRQLVLTRGIDALPLFESLGDAGPLTAPRTAAELLDELLPQYHNAATTDAS